MTVNNILLGFFPHLATCLIKANVEIRERGPRRTECGRKLARQRIVAARARLGFVFADSKIAARKSCLGNET